MRRLPRRRSAPGKINRDAEVAASLFNRATGRLKMPAVKVAFDKDPKAMRLNVRATGKTRILRILNEDQKRKFERMISDLNEKQLR